MDMLRGLIYVPAEVNLHGLITQPYLIEFASVELKRSWRLPGLGKLLGNEILRCIYTQLSEILKSTGNMVDLLTLQI